MGTAGAPSYAQAEQASALRDEREERLVKLVSSPLAAAPVHLTHAELQHTRPAGPTPASPRRAQVEALQVDLHRAAQQQAQQQRVQSPPKRPASARGGGPGPDSRTERELRLLVQARRKPRFCPFFSMQSPPC